MIQEKRDEPKRQIEVIEYIMKNDNYNDYGKVCTIQSYLLGWLTADQIFDPWGIKGTN